MSSKLLVGSIWRVEIEDTSIPEYGSFIDNIRDLLRHPHASQMLCGVPNLPKPTELQLPTLPEPTPIPLPVKDSASRGRGRGVESIRYEEEEILVNLQPILLVSLGLLIDHNVGLIAQILFFGYLESKIILCV